MPRDRLRVRRLVLPAAGAVLAMLAGTSCESYVRARAFEQHAPLREGSLASWIPRTIEGQEALGWLMVRSAVIVGRADFVGLRTDNQKKLILNPMRAGEAVSPSLGSAVAITEDGYFLTAAHCVSEEPFVIVTRDRNGNFVERLGRIVWNGSARGSATQTDVALIHGSDLSTNPIDWCDLANAHGGAEVLSAGVGVGASSRFAAGRILGGPIGDAEAAPGRAHPFRVDSPLIPGDSGGPTILTDGRLLGISANVEIELFSRPGGGEVLRPDPAFIRQRIDADRARRSADTLVP